MIARITAWGLLLGFVILLGCATHLHTIGNGPQKNEFAEERQWYALWGLVPINDVDAKVMAGTATNYEIKTETSALDVLINFFTVYVSITSRTVTVTK